VIGLSCLYRKLTTGKQCRVDQLATKKWPLAEIIRLKIFRLKIFRSKRTNQSKRVKSTRTLLLEIYPSQHEILFIYLPCSFRLHVFLLDVAGKSPIKISDAKGQKKEKRNLNLKPTPVNVRKSCISGGKGYFKQDSS